jgi:DNA-binding transcriptional MerR regulator
MEKPGMERSGMEKSPEAFRTISEVADLLDTPAHVLRFWESRFSQVRPVKRAGGRRYYRPADLALLGGIRKLLHDDGMTIRGVQKILREKGVRHVAALGAAEAPGRPAAPAAAAPEPAPDPAPVPAPGMRSSPFGGPVAAPARGVAGHWPETPAPIAADAEDRLLPDPDDAATPAGEAPMEVDAPTLPLGQPGNVRPLAGAAPIAAETPPAPHPAAPAEAQRPPAAAMLRAMDAFKAREHRGELRVIYTRLSALRDLLAERNEPTRD